jgi:hypothetical protein
MGTTNYLNIHGPTLTAPETLAPSIAGPENSEGVQGVSMQRGEPVLNPKK